MPGPDTCNCQRIYITLTNLKLYKAPGEDQIPNIVLKHMVEVLAAPLTALFQKSLESGYFP